MVTVSLSSINIFMLQVHLVIILCSINLSMGCFGYPSAFSHRLAGCTLAAAIASELAKGSTALQAVQAARRYLLFALRSSAQLSIGLRMRGGGGGF